MKLSLIKETIRTPLYQQLIALRPQMAAAAQEVYNNREDDETGLCDQISEALASVIYSNIAGIEIEEGGHEGDDHAYIYVTNGQETYIVDIPYNTYETGGGYNWQIHPDVIFKPDDVVIVPL